MEAFQSQYVELIVEKQKKGERTFWLKYHSDVLIALDYVLAIALPVVIYTIIGVTVALLVGFPCVHMWVENKSSFEDFFFNILVLGIRLNVVKVAVL